MYPPASRRFPGHGSLWQAGGGGGGGGEVQVTVDRGENVEAGRENFPETMNPRERSGGPCRRPRAEPSPGVHGGPLDEPGQHHAVPRVEVDHLSADPSGGRDQRVVLLGATVDIPRGAFPGEPQDVGGVAFRYLVTDVGEAAFEALDLDTVPPDVAEQ